MARSLWEVWKETLRLWGADPVGMLHVSLLRVFDGREVAGARLDRLIMEKEIREGG